MTLQQTIHGIMDFIVKNDPKHYFQEELEIIARTPYRMKEWYDLFQNATTTWGPRTVLLQRETKHFSGFLGLSLPLQAAVLIHETVHQKQWTYGKLKFFLTYVTEHVKKGYVKNPIEIEARARENNWRKQIGLSLLP